MDALVDREQSAPLAIDEYGSLIPSSATGGVPGGSPGASVPPPIRSAANRTHGGGETSGRGSPGEARHNSFAFGRPAAARAARTGGSPPRSPALSGGSPPRRPPFPPSSKPRPRAPGASPRATDAGAGGSPARASPPATTASPTTVALPAFLAEALGLSPRPRSGLVTPLPDAWRGAARAAGARAAVGADRLSVGGEDSRKRGRPPPDGGDDDAAALGAQVESLKARIRTLEDEARRAPAPASASTAGEDVGSPDARPPPPPPAATAAPAAPATPAASPPSERSLLAAVVGAASAFDGEALDTDVRALLDRGRRLKKLADKRAAGTPTPGAAGGPPPPPRPTTVSCYFLAQSCVKFLAAAAAMEANPASHAPCAAASMYRQTAALLDACRAGAARAAGPRDVARALELLAARLGALARLRAVGADGRDALAGAERFSAAVAKATDASAASAGLSPTDSNSSASSSLALQQQGGRARGAGQARGAAPGRGGGADETPPPPPPPGGPPAPPAPAPFASLPIPALREGAAAAAALKEMVAAVSTLAKTAAEVELLAAGPGARDAGAARAITYLTLLNADVAAAPAQRALGIARTALDGIMKMQ